jgi:hypothetical protein
MTKKAQLQSYPQSRFPRHFRDSDQLIELFLSRDSVPPLDVDLFRHPRNRGKCPGPRNEKGYRADSFEERGDVNLAFIGCSWVEGLGVSRGELFTDQVARLYGEKQGLDCRSWNLGLCATGIDHVVRMMPSVCAALRPDHVLIVLSGFDRREYFTPNRRRHLWLRPQPKRVREGLLTIAEEEAKYVYALGALHNRYNDYAHVLRNFRAAHGMLEAAGIPWLFTSTEYPGAAGPMAALLEMGALPTDNYLGCIFEREDRIAEGDPHPGPKSHRTFAERIVQRLLLADLCNTKPSEPSNMSNQA